MKCWQSLRVNPRALVELPSSEQRPSWDHACNGVWVAVCWKNSGKRGYGGGVDVMHTLWLLDVVDWQREVGGRGREEAIGMRGGGREGGHWNERGGEEGGGGIRMRGGEEWSFTVDNEGKRWEWSFGTPSAWGEFFPWLTSSCKILKLVAYFFEAVTPLPHLSPRIHPFSLSTAGTRQYSLIQHTNQLIMSHAKITHSQSTFQAMDPRTGLHYCTPWWWIDIMCNSVMCGE